MKSEPTRQTMKNRQMQRFLKRCIDVAGACVLLVLSIPVLALVSLLVLCDDGMPIIYRRRVVGLTGTFDAFKFRTMVRNADSILASTPGLKAEFERNFKLKHDPRVTRVGAILRKYSLDELPQFLNVLRGQMSLVGPRMITEAELAKYGAQEHLVRSVRPGLTGYWQVRGRQNVSYEERVALDAHYVTRWSLGMDLRILAETPRKVLKREGAF
jgi:lipopolysaccharide/colanic/teichoic acid biosynthesis glycosyltransferase